MKTATNYIETVYGTKNFTEAIEKKDAQSIIELMDEHSSSEVIKATTPNIEKSTLKPKIELKNLKVENLVSTVFPYTKYYKQQESYFVKKGIAGWPTWVIIIKRESVFNDHLVLFICEIASFTQESVLENPDAFIKNREVIGRTRYFINTKNYGVVNPHNLEIIDAYRLYKFLSNQGIELFEPTQ